MIMKKIALAAFAMSFITSNALATDYNCEGCNFGQMNAKALSFGKGDHKIYSFSTNLAYHFSVTCSGSVPLGLPSSSQLDSRSIESEASDASDKVANGDYTTNAGGSGCAFGNPLEVQTSPFYANEQNAFNLMRAYLIAHPVGASGRGTDIEYNTSEHPGNGGYGDSVTQVLHNNTPWTQLVDEIDLNVPAITQFITAAAAATASNLNIGPNSVAILVTFRDGSSVIINYDRNTKQYTEKPWSARDAAGKALIENNEQHFEGTYNLYGGIGISDYLDLLQRAGVPVTQASGVAKGFSCSWNSGTNTLTCRVIYM